MIELYQIYRHTLQTGCVTILVVCSMGLLAWCSFRGLLGIIRQVPASVRAGIFALAFVSMIFAQKSPRSLGETGAVTMPQTTSGFVAGLSEDDEESVGGGGFHFSAIERTTNGVRLTVSKDTRFKFRGGEFVLRGTHDLQNGEWYDLSVVRDNGCSNQVVEVKAEDLPFEMSQECAFFGADAELDNRLPLLDTDGDGVTDVQEEAWETDANLRDSDGDGLEDGQELSLGTDPLSDDTDGDGVCDAEEIAAGTDPFFAPVELQVPDGPHYEMVGTNTYTDLPKIRSGEAGHAVPSLVSVAPDEINVPGITYHESWSDSYYREGAGASIRALHTGRFVFQMKEADDRAHVYINDMDLSGAYLSEKPENSTVLIAGQVAPIRVSTENDGGPAELSFLKWAHYEPVPRIALDARFTKNTILFEAPYRNSPGEYVGRRSTKTVLRIAANGGQFGGRLRLLRNDGGRLAVNGIMDFNDDGEVIPPGATSRVWTYSFEGVMASKDSDDSQMILSFTEYFTGETLVQTAKVTVVQVKISAEASFPSNKARHVFGPAERISYSLNPVIRNAEWNIGGDVYKGPSCKVLMPASHAFLDVQAAVGSDVSFNTRLMVVEPEESFAVRFRAARDDDWENRGLIPPTPGTVAVGLWTELVLKPSNVSFENLIVYEGFCRATDLTGRFEGLEEDFPVHDSHRGAGNEIPVREGNVCGNDLAAVAFESIAPPWAAGGFVYPVPTYWRTQDEEKGLDLNLMKVESAEYSFSPDGTLAVRRFGCNASRRIDGNTSAWKEEQ